jgi:response regulator RpfG family c-di-GMP phosphodiesterase
MAPLALRMIRVIRACPADPAYGARVICEVCGLNVRLMPFGVFMAREYMGNTQTILIVDDDTSTRNLIADALKEETPYYIRKADSGIKALELLQKKPCDLVISDLKMPGMDGIELLTRIQEINPTTSVIIITGYSSVDISVSAMKSGAIDFLEKPFKIDDLIFKVDICMKEKLTLGENDLDIKIGMTRLNKKIEELSTISYIYDNIEKTGTNNDEVFQEIVALALKVTNGESCSLVLFDEGNNVFHPQIVKSRNNGGYINTGKVSPSLYTMFRDVAQKKEAVLINSNGDSELFKSLLCAPLLIRNKVFGLLNIINSKMEKQFTQKDLNYISSLSRRASLNIENRMLYESVFTSIMDTFMSLIHSIHARDHYTERHSINVSLLAVKTATAMRLSADQIESLKICSVLHDIGKIAIPDSILLKPGRLTDEEYDIIKTHPSIGEDILSHIKLFSSEKRIIRHHHERWDGRGYPDGISGENIPLLSRILAVADTFDAMTNDRPYRKGLTIDTAVNELNRNRNLQFDKTVVDAFISTL